MNTKESYELAIKAYELSVKRFQIWMNYFALFNGALLVAYCSILTSTDSCKAEWSESKVIFDNEHTILLPVICCLGIIASICWLYSIKGHDAWTKSWITSVDNFEDRLFENDSRDRVYSKITLSDNLYIGLKTKENQNDLPIFKIRESRYIPGFFSTTKLAIWFVFFVIVAWFAVLGYSLSFLNAMPLFDGSEIFSILFFGSIPIILLLIIGLPHIIKWNFFCFHSDIKNKYCDKRD